MAFKRRKEQPSLFINLLIKIPFELLCFTLLFRYTCRTSVSIDLQWANFCLPIMLVYELVSILNIEKLLHLPQRFGRKSTDKPTTCFSVHHFNRNFQAWINRCPILHSHSHHIACQRSVLGHGSALIDIQRVDWRFDFLASPSIASD